LQEEISQIGALNSLSAIVMKMGSCGIVDLYQGDECWNYRHVDPDNRASVDYDLRKSLLGKREEKKLWVISQSLALRRSRKELFLEGEYLPLSIENERTIGWIRRHGADFAIILAGRYFHGQKEWEGELILPEEIIASGELINLYTNERIPLHRKGGKHVLLLSDVFREFPAAILIRE
jgi:(1->4)-alpha-D-glucan 1-alpha-D-glucosylmutase